MQKLHEFVVTDTDESAGESAKVEVMTVIKVFSQKMEDLQMCYDLISKHGGTLQKSLSELESLDSATDMTAKVKAINERATLFRIASNKMMNVRINLTLKHLLSLRLSHFIYRV